MPNRAAWLLDLGLKPYLQAWAIQQELHALRRQNAVPDVLILVEHPPVITLGKGFRPENLLFGADYYAQRGIEVCPTDRGGDVTCHNPGQLVGYPIFDVQQHGRDLHHFLRQIEEALIRSLKAFGVEARRLQGYTGVWVGNEKIAAIGIRVARWVSMHGFALNVNNDLSLFQMIVPCGIADKGVTSLSRLLGHSVPMEQVKAEVQTHFGTVFRLHWETPPLEWRG